MKYFRHLFDGAASALEEIFFHGRHADKVIEFYFKNHRKWGKRDRHFFAENVYGAVRWWNQLIELTHSANKSPLEQCHAALAGHLVMNHQPLPAWYDSLISVEIFRAEQSQLSGHLLHAVPAWLEERGQKELGALWPPTITELNKTAPVVLRCNTHQISRDDLQKKLHAENILTELLDPNLFPEALRLVERANVFKTKSFEAGDFEVQDASSQRVTNLLNPLPGERIIDACAGAGGKSLHIASRLGNKGKIISMDISEKKLTELKRRARRAQTFLIETRLIEGTKTIKRLEGSADALLLDVPCSGLGVLKRNPDSKWKLSTEQVENLIKTQKEILEFYTRMVKKGGRCVYATCSVLPSENQNQIKDFINTHPQWTLDREEIILPQTHGFDGFYMALLRSKND